MKKTKKLIGVIFALVAVLCVMVVLSVTLKDQPEQPATTNPSKNQMQSTEPSTEVPTAPSTEPTQPPVYKVSTATISSVGDMLMHKNVFNSGYRNGVYELDLIFEYFSDYVLQADLAAANLETTLAGLDNGYEYNGYPNFNCPDAVVDAMKNAGFDMVLTANNHSYDTRSIGLKRTLEVIKDRDLQYLGTKMDEEEPNFVIAELNGIRVGLMCYTYETENTYDDRISLNGIVLTAEDSRKVNSFDYNDLPAFYAEMEENLADMEALGAEAALLYIHWGDEYRLKANDQQKAIAQKLCDLGIDVIVGGHPHVVEPVELLTSTTDENQKTICLYSMGNAVSNQRLGNISSINTAHTEDGVMFSVTFAKYSDGTVIVEDADILPFWVDMRRNSSGVREYYMLPLDTNIEDWKTQFDLTDATLKKAEESYERTMAIVGDGMTEADAYYAANQAAVEAALGVSA